MKKLPVFALLGALIIGYYVHGATYSISSVEDLTSTIDEAVDGDIIELETGDYLVPSAASVDTPLWKIEKGITIRGKSGNRNDVVFKPANNIANKYLFYLNHSNARIESISITNISSKVSYQKRESATFNVVQGVVSNCAVCKSSFNYVGAIALKSANAAAYDCVIKNCTATDGLDNGAGIFIAGAAFVRNCTVEGNESRQGSALFVLSGNPVITNCVFKNNKSKNTGRGGTAAVYLSSGNALLVSSVISVNQTINGIVSGAGIRLVSGTVRNSLIEGNVNGNGNGGGVNMSGGTIENSTIVNNYTANGHGHGVYQSKGTILNSVIANNAPDYSPINEDNHYKTGGTITYSRTYPEMEGDGNVTDDPFFVDNSTNWHFGDASDLFDHGSNQPWMEGAFDLEGRPRVQNGTVNFGCYEDDTPLVRPLSINATANVIAGAKPLTVDFSSVVKFATSENISYSWNFGDGTTSTEANPRKVYTEFGRFTPSLSVSCDGKSSLFSFSVPIVVGSDVVYLNSDGSAEWPFETPEKGTSNVEDAFDALLPHVGGKAVIYAGPGTYYPVQRMKIADFPIDLVGDDAVFSARDFSNNEKKKGILYVNNDSSVVSGITLRGGGTSSDMDEGIGAALTLVNGMVTNSRIINNSCNVYLVTCVYIKGGTLKDSEISNCTSADSGKGGGGRAAFILNGANARMENCLIKNNSSSVPGEVKNGVVNGCTFVGNVASDTCFMINSGCMVENSIFCENTNTYSSAEITKVIVFSKGSMRNCLVAKNATKANAAVASSGASGAIENCTIADNYQTTVVAGYAGVLVNGGARMQNSISFANFSKAGDEINWGGDGVFANNLFTNPKFVSSANDDYRLRTKSPARDAAEVLPWMEGAVDLDGNERVSGHAPDLGCYECNLPLPLMFLLK